MAKWHGNIGFAITEEVRPGVFEEKEAEYEYFGDLLRNSRRLQSSSNLNDNISINNEISIVSNPFIRENFHAIRYATYMGSKWKVTTVDIQYPRIILSLGDLYNG